MTGMTRTRITALALALALPLTTVHAVEPAVAQIATIDLDTEEKRARLTAQAVEELINEYRVANGLHPLVTHELYDAQALNWTNHMIAQIPDLGHPKDLDGEGAFQHSDEDELGHSGENILYHGPYEDTAEDWSRAVMELFEDWRNSPEHNANMLRADVQGMGLGLARNGNEIWGTTMFFIQDTPLRGTNGNPASLAEDDLSRAAAASGKPFYVPAGAKELLGVGDVKDPRDIKGHTISREVDFREKGIFTVVPATVSGQGEIKLDKTIGAVRGIDPVVTGKPVESLPVREPVTSVPEVTPPPSALVPNPAPSPAQEPSKAPKSETSKPAASKTVTPETKSSEPATKPAESSTSEKVTPTKTPTRDVKTPTQTPTQKSPQTPEKSNGSTKEQTPDTKPTGGQDGSSKTIGIVVGVIAALLVAIGAVVVALPTVAPELAKQLGIPRIF